MKRFDPNTFISDFSLNLKNLNPEAGDVTTLSDESVNVLMIILIRMLHIISRKEQRSFNKSWLIKGILTSIAKKNTFDKSIELLASQILLDNAKPTEISLRT